MKKFLGIVVLGLLLITSAYAKSIKPGSGPLKLSEETVRIFHIYLTERLTEKKFEEENLPGMIFPGGTKARYGNHFHIIGKDRPYIWVWWNESNPPADTRAAFGCNSCRMFAKSNKIMWKKSKKRISRKVSLEELKVILKELGFYDGD